MKYQKWATLMLWILIGWGVCLRLYQFGYIPRGLNRDEAALGYNAFTVAHYGMDEWSRKWPLIFESFGDFKLPGYIYTLAPIIKIFGIHDGIIRLPSLLAGLALIYLSFLIVRLVTKSQLSGLFAAALIAISPWAVFYGRTAFEAHLALAWLVLTIYWLLKPTKIKNSIFIGVTYLIAGLTYNTPLLLTPILIIFCLSLPKRNWRDKVKLIVPLIVVAVGLVFWFRPLISQKQNITIFSDPTVISTIAHNYSQAQTGLARLEAGKFSTWLIMASEKLVQSLSLKFLVIRGGDHPWHTVPGNGHVYVVGLVLFWLAVILILFRKVSYWREGLSFILLTLGALLPAIITIGAPHATRSLLFFWGMTVLGSLVILKFKKFIIILIVILGLESARYAYNYFVIYPNLTIKPYPYGFKELANEIKRLNKPIAITNAPNSGGDILGDQVYIWFLLYGEVSPIEYQQTKLETRDVANMVRVTQFERFKVYNEQSEVPPESEVIERQDNNLYRLKSL